MFSKRILSWTGVVLSLTMAWAISARAGEHEFEYQSLDQNAETHPLYFDAQCCDADSFVPLMLGDFIGGFSFAPAPGAKTQPRAVARSLKRFKVADNNSPRPHSRLLYSYNYFRDAFDTDGDVHRNFLGAEAAFFDRRMSVELKTSVNRYSDFESADSRSDFSDLRLTLKTVLIDTGNAVLSAGGAVGIPISDAPGAISDSNYYLAPFVGGLFAPQGSNWFVQGFGQLDVPTEGDDQIVWHTDLGIGYFLRRGETDRFIQTVAPTVELHAYTPVGESSGVYEHLNYDDVVNMTVGTTFVLPAGLTVATGVGMPVSTNKDYDVEFQLHVNWFFGADAPR